MSPASKTGLRPVVNDARVGWFHSDSRPRTSIFVCIQLPVLQTQDRACRAIAAREVGASQLVRQPKVLSSLEG